jgi:hypothetical protein
MVLAALFRQLTMEATCRVCRVRTSNLLLVDAGSGFLEKVTATTTKDRRIPTHPTLLRSTLERVFRLLVVRASKAQDSRETKREHI